MHLSSKQKIYGITSILISIIFTFWFYKSLNLDDNKKYINNIKEITSLILTIFSIWFGMMKYHEIRDSSSSFLRLEKHKTGDHLMAFILCCFNLIFYIFITVIIDIILKKYADPYSILLILSSFLIFLSSTIIVYSLHVCLRPIIHFEDSFIRRQKENEFQESHYRSQKIESDKE
ncbi:hypothetical protein MSP8887_04044 [Marinomonas spartinae]|nr:hypothetical protein MSP8887_04044 [Marinomonas spartinae]